MIVAQVTSDMHRAILGDDHTDKKNFNFENHITLKLIHATLQTNKQVDGNALTHQFWNFTASTCHMIRTCSVMPNNAVISRSKKHATMMNAMFTALPSYVLV